MEPNIELQFLHTQLNSNNYMLTLLQQDMAGLATMMQNKRANIKQLEDYNLQIQHRINALDLTNQSIVLYTPFE